MSQLIRRSLVVLAAALAAGSASLVGAVPALAGGDNGSFAAFPTSAAGSPVPRQYFVYTMPAGQSVHDSVSITNLTSAPKTFLVYGTDGFTTATDGALGFRSRTDAQHQIGAWVSLASNRLTVPAKTIAEVPLTLHVPAATAPGDYAGGVVVLDTAVAAGSGGADIGVQQAIAVRVYLHVDGATVAGLQVESVRVDRSVTPARLLYRLRNTGNSRLGPDVDIRVTGLLHGDVWHTTKQLPGDLLPGNSAQYSVSLPALPTADLLTVRVGVAASGVTASGHVRVLIAPWWLLAGGGAVLAALIAAAVLWLMRRRAPAPPAPASPEQPRSEPETVPA